MKDLLVAISIAGCLALGMAVWRGISGNDAPQLEDEAQYAKHISVAEAGEIAVWGWSWAQWAADRLAAREWSKLLARSDDAAGARLVIAQFLVVPTRRLALVVALIPVLVPLVLASLAFGLYSREESMLLQRWRSPTVAYLAKKCFFYPGLLGVLLFCTLPMSLPLWLIYAVFIPLCGGLTLYVGSIGRI
jgi:hypothetical protein